MRWGYRKPEVLSVSQLKPGKEEVLQMNKVLVIVMLIIAIGLVGCPRRHYDRHDKDRGHDYEHRDRDRDNRGHRK